MRSKLLFVLSCFGGLTVIYFVFHLYKETTEAYEKSEFLATAKYSWFFRLLLNLVGYGMVMGPGVVIYKYLASTNYFEKTSSPTWWSRALFSCFAERGERLPDKVEKEEEAKTPPGAGELAFCFSGLMAAYLVWGLLQEKIMTQTYVMWDGRAGRFGDSQLLVLANRLAALGLAAARLRAVRRPLAPAPLYRFSYCALTNVLSAWCQYEALKYVSFPTQVLSKSCKVIPVMMMSWLVSGTRHTPRDYLSAGLITTGMVLFLYGTHDSQDLDSKVTTLSGLVLLSLYMTCDSFTSSWQGELFNKYKCTPLQMLVGVNTFSCLLTAGALLQQQTSLLKSLEFLQNPSFVVDCVVLSASSALGQLLIYRTIANFGPVVFTVIMTLRQAASILLSCLVYGHALSASGAIGACVVVAAALLRVYWRRPRRPSPHHAIPLPPPPARPAPV